MIVETGSTVYLSSWSGIHMAKGLSTSFQGVFQAIPILFS